MRVLLFRVFPGVWAPALTLPDFGIGLLVSEQRLAIICEHLLSPFVLGRHRQREDGGARLPPASQAVNICEPHYEISGLYSM